MSRTILEDDWVAEFKPLPAPQPGSGYDYGDGCTLIDGHSREDLTYLKSVESNRIWTVVTGDGDAIIPGFHVVNRLGNIVTEKPWTNDIADVELEDLSDD